MTRVAVGARRRRSRIEAIWRSVQCNINTLKTSANTVLLFHSTPTATMTVSERSCTIHDDGKFYNLNPLTSKCVRSLFIAVKFNQL